MLVKQIYIFHGIIKLKVRVIIQGVPDFLIEITIKLYDLTTT